MTTPAPTARPAADVGVPPDPQAAEAVAAYEAAVRAFELAVTTASVAAVAGPLAAILLAVYVAWRNRVSATAQAAVRRRAAAALSRLRPDVAAALARQVVAGQRLGDLRTRNLISKSRELSTTPVGNSRDFDTTDPLIRDALRAANPAVLDRLDALAARLAAPIRTDADIAAIEAAERSAAKAAERYATRVANRSVAAGAAKAAGDFGERLVWVAERDACIHCAAYAGATAEPDGDFHPAAAFDPHPLPWSAHGLIGPPLHDWCRCRVMPATAWNVLALRREAQRSVARGFSAFDSVPQRLAASGLLLAGRTGDRNRLPKSVVERAGRDHARRKFSTRHL